MPEITHVTHVSTVPLCLPSAPFEPTDNNVNKDKSDDGRTCNAHCRGYEKIKQYYSHDVFLLPKVPGPRRRSASDRLSKEGGLSLRSEGAVNSTIPMIRSSGSKVAAESL
jgi:hypothetical protein